MQAYPLSSNEAARLRALDDLCILATPPEPHFDAVVTLARRLFDVPVAFIAFQDQRNQWFKAHSGISVDAPTRDLAICNYTLLGRGAFVVPDLSADERFAAMPYVAGEPHLRFYAGMPLALKEGLPLGTLCIMDTRVRDLSLADLGLLGQLAEIVVTFLRHHETELARRTAEAGNERLRLEAQLRQAQKMEAIGQLTGGVAHDFNNLLTVILGNAEILAEHLPDPHFRSMAEMIREGAERGADLTRHLLAFGRRQSLKPVPLSLDEVVQGMMPLLQRTLGAQVELRTEFSRSQLSALADRALLENAIINLAVNARDAMPHGGVLTITTGERVAGPGDGTLPIGQEVVFVTISDTGTGMPPEVLSRVFEPFFTTKEVGKGSGLGLPMVYGFAEQSGGHVSIKSRVGEGTSVTILLRAVTTSLAEPALSMDQAVLRAGKERVLVVEDDPQVLQFVSAQLVSLGYEVTAVSTGSDALDILKRDDHFDLLFTDVVLPKGMSGVELARRARQIRSNLKALLTSGYSEDVFEQHGRPEEGTLLLRKPYRRKQLADTIGRALDPPQ